MPLIDDNRSKPYPPKPLSHQQERVDEVRAVLRGAGWHPCRIARWLQESRLPNPTRLEACNGGGFPFEMVLAEAREIAGRR